MLLAFAYSINMGRLDAYEQTAPLRESLVYQGKIP